jgi:hypothetical protein
LVNALIEPFRWIYLLSKWTNDLLLGEVIAANRLAIAFSKARIIRKGTQRRRKLSKPSTEQARHMQLKVQRRHTRQLFSFTTNCSKLRSLNYLRIPSITLIFLVLS